MKIILYTNRNVGLLSLSYLVAKGFDVTVISEDNLVVEMANSLGRPVIEIETIGKDFDYFICIHGRKIIPKELLQDGKMINIHPCLYKYKGHNPIKNYILNEDNHGTVESQYMIEEVDAGDVIHREDFNTGRCANYADFYNIALPYYFRCIESTINKITK